MSSLFGVELPTPVNFVIAFVVVLALIGAVAWLLRRFGTGRLDASARSRQPRLAVIDAASVDGRRKLVIIRRDNVEHLLMIGGPTDVVVETNIVRSATVAARETPIARNGGADVLPRAMPLPDPSSWPLQPEPAAAAARTDRTPRVVAEDTPTWQAQHGEPAATPTPPARVARPGDALAGLAAELTRPAPELVAVPRAVPEPVAVAPPAATASPQAPPDQSLAEMAQRLEAALRRPTSQAKPAAAGPAKPAAESTAPRVVVAAETKPPARIEPKAAVQARGGGAQPRPHGSLEQEMASLLGRPGKT
jgi:hypothetical protein